MLPEADYDNKVRDLGSRSHRQGRHEHRADLGVVARREFLLELSSGFVYDVLRASVEQLDMSDHRRMVLEHFAHEALHVLRGHKSPIWMTLLSSDGLWAVTGSRTETICWNLIDGKPVTILDKCTSPVLLPDEEHLLVTSPEGPSLWKLHFESLAQNMLFRV